MISLWLVNCPVVRRNKMNSQSSFILFPSLFLLQFCKWSFRFEMKILPTYMPAIGVRTPLAEITALLVNAPAAGIDDTKLPNMLHKPSVNISCVAFTLLPHAKNTNILSRYAYLYWCAITNESLRICIQRHVNISKFRTTRRRSFSGQGLHLGSCYFKTISKHFDSRNEVSKLHVFVNSCVERDVFLFQKFNANLE